MSKPQLSSGPMKARTRTRKPANPKNSNVRIRRSGALRRPSPSRPYRGLAGLRRRRPFAHFPGLPRACPDMSSPRGEPVNAVYGFIRDLLQLIEQSSPPCSSAPSTCPAPPSATQIYDHTKPTAADARGARRQIPKIEQVLHALAIPVTRRLGFEADDVLATIARLCDEGGAPCFIVTRRQRLPATDHRPRRRLQHPQGRSLRRHGPCATGVSRPSRSSTSRPSSATRSTTSPVSPIGPKTAQELLEEYGTLENVLDHADEIPGAKAKNCTKTTTRPPFPGARPTRRLCARPRLELRPRRRFRPAATCRPVRRIRLPLPRRPLRQARGSDCQHPIHGTPTTRSSTRREARLARRRPSPSSRSSRSTPKQPTSCPLGRDRRLLLRLAPGKAATFPSAVPPAKRSSIPPHARSPAAGARKRRHRQDRPEPEVRHDRAPQRRRHLAGVTFDTMVANYLLDAGERSHNLDDLAHPYLNHTTSKSTS